MTARLCFVLDSFAWFTTLPLTEQWGDDWNDAPYQWNAGEPYGEIGTTLTKLAFEVNGDTPDDAPAYSVEQINAGAVPWLRSWPSSETEWSIPAEATPEEFTRIIQEAGGTVYAPVHALVPAGIKLDA